MLAAEEHLWDFLIRVSSPGRLLCSARDGEHRIGINHLDGQSVQSAAPLQVHGHGELCA